MHCEYFDATRKDNHSSFLTPTVVGGRRPFRLIFALKLTHPFEKRRPWQISAYNVSRPSCRTWVPGTNHPVSLCPAEIQLNPWIILYILAPCSHLMDTADQTLNGVLASRHQSCPPFGQYGPQTSVIINKVTRLSNYRLISPTVCIRDMDCTCHRH